MNQHKQQVRRFYDLLWNAHDRAAIPTILHQDITFRGSLGHIKHGHAGIGDYVDMVHEALGDYYCTIKELVAEANKVFAKMVFSGIHKNNFMGYKPSGERLNWGGCALFTFSSDLIVDIWVLGDLKFLEHQLKQN